MLAKTIKRAAIIDVFSKTLFLLSSRGANQNFVKGVSLSASQNSQKNDVQQTKWLLFLTSDLTMTPFFNFWHYNFNLKPLSRNHPWHGASLLTNLDASWSIDHKSTLWQFSLGLHLIIRYTHVLSLFPHKAHLYLSTLQQRTKHCHMTSPDVMTSPNNIICYKQLLYCIWSNTLIAKCSYSTNAFKKQLCFRYILLF